MSVTNIDFNFSSSGGQHQATITDVVSEVVCGAPIIKNEGRSFRTSNQQINDLLDCFLIEEKTIERDSRTERNVYRLIDKTSALLRRTVALVRGVNAPIQGGTSSSGLVFASSQHPRSKYRQTFAGSHGVFSGEVYNGFVILGSSYSRFSGERKTFSGGKFNVVKSEFFFQNGVKVDSLSYGPNFEYDESDSSIVSGYTAKEFLQMLRFLGITVSGYIPNNDVALFTESGSLADCLSSICNFYGYYWYIKPFNKNLNISIIDSSSANALIPPSPAPSSEILSYSETISYRNKYQVLSFFGSSDPITNEISASYPDRPIKKKFKLIDDDGETIGEKTGHFFTFLSQFKDFSPKAFDVLFYCGLYTENKDLKFNFQNKDIKFELEEKREKLLKDEIGVSSSAYEKLFDDYKKKVKRPKLSSSAAYALLKNNGEQPSDKILEYLKVAYTLVGRFYISKKHSEYFTQNYSYQGGEGVTVTKPYHKDTQVKNIPELLPFVQVGWMKDTMTIEEVSKTYGFEKGRSAPALREGYYYLAVKQEIEKDEKTDEYTPILEQCHDAFESFFNKGQKSYVILSSKGVVQSVSNLLIASQNKYAEYVRNREKKIECFGAKINSGEEDESGEDIEPPNVTRIECNIITSGRISNTSETEVISFEGTPEEISSFRSSVNLGQQDIKTTSTTYSGLQIPETGTMLGISSMSFSFTDQGISTTIERSNLPFIPQDRSLILNGKSVKNFGNSYFGAGTKNYFGLT